MSRFGTNSGHGYVWERPDGLKAKCGGPMICGECAKDFAEFQAAWNGEAKPTQPTPSYRLETIIAQAIDPPAWNGVAMAAVDAPAHRMRSLVVARGVLSALSDAGLAVGRATSLDVACPSCGAVSTLPPVAPSQLEKTDE